MSFLSACVSTQDVNSVKSSGENSAESKAIAKDMIAMMPSEKVEKEDAKAKTNTTNELVGNTRQLNQGSTLPINLMNNFLAQQKIIKKQLAPETLAAYQKAIKAVKNKQWLSAKTLLQQVVLQSPNLSGAYYYQAIAAYNQQAFEDAKSFIAQAILLNDNNPYSFNLQAVIARKVGDFNLAENSYIKAITIWPNYSEAHLNFAVFLELYRGRLPEAKKHYLQYLTLKPEDKIVIRWLAGLELKLVSKEAVNEGNS